jgi:hypothetical protein
LELALGMAVALAGAIRLAVPNSTAGGASQIWTDSWSPLPMIVPEAGMSPNSFENGTLRPETSSRVLVVWSRSMIRTTAPSTVLPLVAFIACEDGPAAPNVLHPDTNAAATSGTNLT